MRRSRPHRSHPHTRESADLPDVLQFMQLLWQIVHLLQKRSKRMAADLGVTGPQRLVLRIVGLIPGTSAGTLAGILHVHPSTLTGVLQRLVTQGLLRRNSEANDRRRAVLSLTSRGERVNAVGEGTVEAAIASALAALAPRDAAATERALTAIAEHLERSATPRGARKAIVSARRSRAPVSGRSRGGRPARSARGR